MLLQIYESQTSAGQDFWWYWQHKVHLPFITTRGPFFQALPWQSGVWSTPRTHAPVILACLACPIYSNDMHYSLNKTQIYGWFFTVSIHKHLEHFRREYIAPYYSLIPFLIQMHKRQKRAQFLMYRCTNINHFLPASSPSSSKEERTRAQMITVLPSSVILTHCQRSKTLYEDNTFEMRATTRCRTQTHRCTCKTIPPCLTCLFHALRSCLGSSNQLPLALHMPPTSLKS